MLPTLCRPRAVAALAGCGTAGKKEVQPKLAADVERLEQTLDALPPFPVPRPASGSLWTDGGPGAGSSLTTGGGGDWTGSVRGGSARHAHALPAASSGSTTRNLRM